MPFTILKIPKTGDAEVIGEFGTQAEADAFTAVCSTVPIILMRRLFGNR